MPARAVIENGEVIKNKAISAGNREIARLTLKTSNYAGKSADGSPKFEDVWLMVTCFSPTEEVKRLANGDKVNIGIPSMDDEGETNLKSMANLRIDSNPNVFQIHKSELAKTSYNEDDLTPSRFPEVLCFGNQIELREKADTTRTRSRGRSAESSKPEPRETDYPVSDHGDDFPY